MSIFTYVRACLPRVGARATRGVGGGVVRGRAPRDSVASAGRTSAADVTARVRTVGVTDGSVCGTSVGGRDAETRWRRASPPGRTPPGRSRLTSAVRTRAPRRGVNDADAFRGEPRGIESRVQAARARAPQSPPARVALTQSVRVPSRRVVDGPSCGWCG